MLLPNRVVFVRKPFTANGLGRGTWKNSDQCAISNRLGFRNSLVSFDRSGAPQRNVAFGGSGQRSMHPLLFAFHPWTKVIENITRIEPLNRSLA